MAVQKRDSRLLTYENMGILGVSPDKKWLVAPVR